MVSHLTADLKAMQLPLSSRKLLETSFNWFLALPLIGCKCDVTVFLSQSLNVAEHESARQITFESFEETIADQVTTHLQR